MIQDTHPSRALRVFLCHSSGDKAVVRQLYQQLLTDGFDPWLDEEKLLPGSRWKDAITKAVRESDVVIVCLSQSSISKRGFVQREIRYALDVALEQPEDQIFLIPVKLEECDVPPSLSDWHWVNFFEDHGYDRLKRALAYRAGANLNVRQSAQEHLSPPSGKSEDNSYKAKNVDSSQISGAKHGDKVLPLPSYRDSGGRSFKAHSRLDNLTFQVESTLAQVRWKLEPSVAASVEATIADAKRALSEGGVDRMNESFNRLQKSSDMLAGALKQPSNVNNESGKPVRKILEDLFGKDPFGSGDRKR